MGVVRRGSHDHKRDIGWLGSVVVAAGLGYRIFTAFIFGALPGLGPLTVLRCQVRMLDSILLLGVIRPFAVIAVLDRFGDHSRLIGGRLHRFLILFFVSSSVSAAATISMSTGRAKCDHGDYRTPGSGLWVRDRVLEVLHCLTESMLGGSILSKRVVVLGIAFEIAAVIRARIGVKTVDQVVLVQSQLGRE